jgi:hypothetical protein
VVLDGFRETFREQGMPAAELQSILLERQLAPAPAHG